MAVQDMPGFRFRVEERTPAHTTVRVFVGEEGQGGSAGLLTFRNEEYDVLAPMLLAAGDMLAALERVKGGFDDDSDGESPASRDGYWPLWMRTAHDSEPSVREAINAAIRAARGGA